MKMFNLTPHAVNLMDDNNTVIATFTPAGIVARAKQVNTLIGTVDANGVPVPVYRAVYGAIENLPEPKEGCVYLVSALTAQAAKGRDDVYVTMDPVRDDQGRIIGCRAFGKI